MMCAPPQQRLQPWVPKSPTQNGAYVVQGEGVGGLRSPNAPLDFGNSGTGSRLMLGVVAGNDVIAEFTGDASLAAGPWAACSHH